MLYSKPEDFIKTEVKKHNHYFKQCPFDKIDVYRVTEIFEVNHPCLQHALKKVLCTGGRGYKSIDVDIQDAIDSLLRWQEMKEEYEAATN